MRLRRIQLTLEDKTDFSGKSKEEVAEARAELAKEMVNRITQAIAKSGLIQYNVGETEGHGLRATATLGVYDIREMDEVQEAAPEEPEKEKVKS